MARAHPGIFGHLIAFAIIPLLLGLYHCVNKVNEPFTPRLIVNPYAPLSEASLNALLLDSTISQFFSGPVIGVDLLEEGRWSDLLIPYEERSPCAVTTVTYSYPAILSIHETIEDCPVSRGEITAITRGEAEARWAGDLTGFTASVNVAELTVEYSSGDRVVSKGSSVFISSFTPGVSSGVFRYEFFWQIADLRLGESQYEGVFTGTVEEERYRLKGFWRFRGGEVSVAGLTGTPEPLLDYTLCLLTDPRGGVYSFFPLFPVSGKVQLFGSGSEVMLHFADCSATILDPGGLPLVRFEGRNPDDQSAYLKSWGGVIPGIRLYRLSGLSLFGVALFLYRYCTPTGDCFQFRFLPELDPGGTSLLRQGSVTLIRRSGEVVPGGFEIRQHRLVMRFPDLNQILLYDLSPTVPADPPLVFTLNPVGGGQAVTWTASPRTPSP